MSRYALAIAAGLAAMVAWSAWSVNLGVKVEQVRVEKKGKQTNAAAKERRKAVAAKNTDEIRADLRRFCVDCE